MDEVFGEDLDVLAPSSATFFSYSLAALPKIRNADDGIFLSLSCSCERGSEGGRGRGGGREV